MKRIIALILIFITVLCVFSGCKKDARSGDETTAPSGSVTTAGGNGGGEGGETEDPQKTLTLPDGLNFSTDGVAKQINILQRTNTKDEMYYEKPTGDLIGDTIYERNKDIEQKLGVKLSFHDVQGTNTTYGTYKAAITAAAASGEETYHIIANYAYFGASLAVEGVYYDLNELNPAKENYLAFNKLWWNQNYQKEATINGKLFFLEGDVTISAINRLEVLFYNMNMAKSLFPDADFLEMVYSREFTYEYFLQCIVALGNGEQEGVWGCTMPRNSTSIDGFVAALDVDIVQRNTRNIPEISFNTDRTISIARALRTLYQENQSVLGIEDSGRTVNEFIHGKSLFHINMMSYAGNEKFRNLSFEFAIMPLPIWNENQENYKITAHDEYSTLSVPLCVLSTDAVSAVMEYMGYLSYNNLRPVLYEKCYKVRYLATLPKAKMFDYIIDNSFFDFGYIYSNAIGNPVHILRDNIRYPDKNQLLTDVQSGASVSAVKLKDFIAKLYE